MKLYKKVAIESLYSDIEKNVEWKNFYNYISLNANTCKIHKITDRELRKFCLKQYGTLAVGGWAEGIAIKIISNVIFDVGKKAIKKLLQLVSKTGKQRVKQHGFSEFGQGNVSITFKYKVNVTIEINVSFETDNDDYLTSLSLTLIESQLKKSKKALLFYISSEKKYTENPPW